MILIPLVLAAGSAGLIIYKVYRIITRQEARSGFNIIFVSVFFISMCSRIKEVMETFYVVDKNWFYAISFTTALLIGILMKVKGVDEEALEKREVIS